MITQSELFDNPLEKAARLRASIENEPHVKRERLLAALQKYLDLNLSPLPVAPLQDAFKYPLIKKGAIVYVEGSDSIPKPRFNGKNPSYLDDQGIPQEVYSSHYRDKQPTQAELNLWFADPLNGLGYLHTVLAPNLRTLDIDRKHFDSQADCDQYLDKILAHPGMNHAYVEKTRSGGYHILLECKADFTNFSFGELLGAGRFAVCAPTDGYQVHQDGAAVKIEAPESIGVYPTKAVKKAESKISLSIPHAEILDSKKDEPEKNKPEIAIDKPISLYRILSNPVKSYINGDMGNKKDKSKLLVHVRNEAYGWGNWCKKNDVPLIDESEELINLAAKNLGIDPDRKARILKSCISQAECVPPIFGHQGDLGCWNKLRKLLGIKIDALQKAIAINHGERAKRRKFDTDVFVNHRFLESKNLMESLEKYSLVCLKSPMGTGKTEILIDLVLAFHDAGFLLLGARNSLLLQTVERLSDKKRLPNERSFYHMQTEEEGRSFTADPYSRLALCVDSLHVFSDPSQFDDRILILDETVSTMIHALLSPTVASQKGGRIEHLRMFEEAVKRAKFVILLDGNLSDPVCEWIKKIRQLGDRPASMIKLENLFKPDKLNVTFIKTFEGEDDKPFDTSPMKRHILTILKSIKGLDKGICYIADSQEAGEVLDRKLTALGYKVLRIDSKTIEETQIREILKHINEVIAREKYDALILSPTVEMGVDISIKDYFVAVFAQFTGLLSTNSQLQFLNRVRDCKNWFIHCVPYTNLQQHKKLDDIGNIIEYCVRKSWDGEDQKTILNHALNQLEIAKESVHYSFIRDILEDLIHERKNSYYCLIEALRLSHNVTEVRVETCDEEKDENYAIRDELRAEISERILNADNIEISEARELCQKLGKTEEEKAEIDKAFLLNKLPGIDESEIWKPELIKYLKYENREADIKKLERFWSVQNLNDARLMAQRSLVSAMSEDERETDDRYEGVRTELGLKSVRKLREFLPWDLKVDPVPQAIIDSGLIELLDGNPHREESEEVQAIVEAIKANPTYQKIFSVKPSMPAMKMIGIIFDLIGVKSKGKQVRQKEGGKIREYVYHSMLEQQDKDEIRVRNQTLFDCIDRRMKEHVIDKDGERYEEPKSDDFDNDSLQPRDVPSIKNWMSQKEVENIEMIWKDALESDKEYKSMKARNEVLCVVRDLWRKHKQNEGLMNSGLVIDDSDDNFNYQGAV